jgi:hypothetical protein
MDRSLLPVASRIFALVAVFAPAHAMGGVPSASSSIVPCSAPTCPGGDASFQVLVRDGANNAVPGSVVILNWSAVDGLALCSPIASCPTPCTIAAITDGDGRASFAVPAGGAGSGESISVTADGVPLGYMSLYPMDQDGDFDVDETDYNIAAAAESLGGGRSDFNCNGYTDANDLQLLRTHSGHRCASAPPVEPHPPSNGAWMRVWTKGDLPGRRGHAMVLDALHARMVLFGGLHESPVWPYGWLDDTWELGLVPEPTWAPLATSRRPPPRIDHGAVYDAKRNRMVVFGGFGCPFVHCDVFNDVWSLSLVGPAAWERVWPGGPGPEGRRSQVTVYDPVRDRIIVFAGIGYECHFPWGCRPKVLSDLWELRLEAPPSWRRLEPSGEGPGSGQFLGVYDERRDRLVVHEPVSSSSYALSLDEPPRWSRIVTTTRAPGARPEASWLVADPFRDRVVLMPGRDVFALDFSTEPAAWTRLDPIGGPSPLIGGQALVYDPVADRVLAFGGGYSYDGLGFFPTLVRALNFGKPLRIAAVDVRPGSPENVIPLGAGGSLPVLVHGSADVDVGLIELQSVRLAGAAVKLRGDGEAMATYGDHDADGFADWLLHFDLRDLRLHVVETSVVLTGRMRDGGGVAGRDRVRIIDGANQVGGERADPSRLSTEGVDDRGVALRLAVRQVHVASDGLHLSLMLPGRSAARVELFDVGGRRIAKAVLGRQGALELVLPTGTPLRPGLYFVRLSQEDGSVVRRVVQMP